MSHEEVQESLSRVSSRARTQCKVGRGQQSTGVNGRLNRYLFEVPLKLTEVTLKLFKVS